MRPASLQPWRPTEAIPYFIITLTKNLKDLVFVEFVKFPQLDNVQYYEVSAANDSTSNSMFELVDRKMVYKSLCLSMFFFVGPVILVVIVVWIVPHSAISFITIWHLVGLAHGGC